MGGPSEPAPLTAALRWAARAWSLLTLALVAGFLIGEGGPGTPAEWAGFVFFPAGVCGGLLLAWRREGLGGAVATASLAAFYLVHRATAGAWPTGWAWLALAAPGPLFLLCRLNSRR